MNLLEQLPPILTYAEIPFSRQPAERGEQLVMGPRASYHPERGFSLEYPLYLSLMSRNALLGETGARDVLELLVQYPGLQIPAPRQADVLRLLRSFNLILPFGRMMIDPRSSLQYRFSWLLDVERFEGALLLETIDTVWFYSDQLAWRIEAVAQGEISLEDMLQLELALPQNAPVEPPPSLLG